MMESGNVEQERLRISAFCVKCLIEKQYKKAEQLTDEKERAAYMRQVMQILTDNMDRLSTPVIESYFNRLLQSHDTEYFRSIKKKYNDMFLVCEEEIYSRIMKGAFPIKTALQYVEMGNYIDFGVNDLFNKETLKQLMNQVENNDINEETYSCFLNDIASARHLVYLMDNCGEVVLDKIFIRVLKNKYPQLEITAVVRGENIVNDVNMEDARSIDLHKTAKVISNGTDIAGTSMEHINEETRQAIFQADMIISKGQGNFETMYGTGFRTYYIFLCKCEWFMKRFHCEKNTAVFQSEQAIQKLFRES